MKVLDITGLGSEKGAAMIIDHESKLQDIRRRCLLAKEAHLALFRGVDREGNLQDGSLAVILPDEIIIEGHLNLPRMVYTQIDRFAQEHIYREPYRAPMRTVKDKRAINRKQLLAYVTNEWIVSLGSRLEDIEVLMHSEKDFGVRAERRSALLEEEANKKV